MSLFSGELITVALYAKEGSGAPTVADVPLNSAVIWRNTSLSGDITIYFNDNGTLRWAGIGTVNLALNNSSSAVSASFNIPPSQLNLTDPTISSNRVFAGPTTGTAASATFRVLVAKDLAQITLPTSDPHVVGSWWNNAGVVTISAG